MFPNNTDPETRAHRLILYWQMHSQRSRTEDREKWGKKGGRVNIRKCSKELMAMFRRRGCMKLLDPHWSIWGRTEEDFISSSHSGLVHGDFSHLPPWGVNSSAPLGCMLGYKVSPAKAMGQPWAAGSSLRLRDEVRNCQVTPPATWRTWSSHSAKSNLAPWLQECGSFS